MEGWAGEMMGEMASRDAGKGLACGKRIGEENGGKRREAILGSESMTSKLSGHGRSEGRSAGRGWMYSGEYLVMKSQYSAGKASRSKRKVYSSWPEARGKRSQEPNHCRCQLCLVGAALIMHRRRKKYEVSPVHHLCLTWLLYVEGTYPWAVLEPAFVLVAVVDELERLDEGVYRDSDPPLSCRMYQQSKGGQRSRHCGRFRREKQLRGLWVFLSEFLCLRELKVRSELVEETIKQSMKDNQGRQ
jgi:hypothetical protein